MAAETLNFGPEWLRALSGGATLPSPPPSPALPRLRSAAKRYGREEMLALYVPGDKAPEEIQEFTAIAQEEPLPPLALLPLTEEEQKNFSQSVNSVAVLRLMGRAGGGSAAGGGRGRVGTRSRGRGRAEGGFFPRGAEEPEGFGRGREVTRSQSWDDRGERRFEKPPRRDGGRAPFEESGGGGGPRKEPPRSDSTNWRSLREEPGGEEELGVGAGGGNWRLGPPPRPHRDPHGREGERWRGSSPDPPRWRRRAEAEPRGDDERRWTRDGTEDGDRNRNRNRDGDRDGDAAERDALPEWCMDDEDEEMGTFDASGAFLPCKKGPREPPPEDPDRAVTPSGDATPEPPQGTPPAPPQDPPPEARPTPEPPPAVSEPDPPAPPTGTQALPPPSDVEDEEGMKHLQQEAEKLVASLQEDERFGGGSSLRAPTQALPLAHEAARKWFYRDPQGDIQGPFSPQEMGEWFHAGYFPMALMVKRGCDEGFQPLGDVIKMWGRVPFAPGPSPPPLMGNLDQERLKKQQELAATALYHQLQHQQFLHLLGRQPPAPCPAPPPQKTPSLGELTPQQLAAFLQALKPSRTGEQNLLRSLALPDGASLWDGSNPPGADPGLWELPLSSPPAQSPILEQLQLQHKLQELRARRDEDDQRKRRRQEEELRRKQCRQQETLLKLLQQSGASPGGAPPPPWALPKAPIDGERPPPHKPTRGLRAVGGALGGPWGTELLWTPPEKNPGTAPWEESAPGGGVLRGGGGKGRSGTAMGDPPFRRRRTEEEEKSKALRLWCEAALVALGAPEGASLPFPPPEPEPHREGLGWARAPPQGGGGGGGGDPPPSFSRPPLMERMGRAPGPPPHSPQEQWLGAAALPPPQFGPGPKLPPPEAKAKRRPLLLHNDPSILGYALHCPGGEVEMVEDF